MHIHQNFIFTVTYILKALLPRLKTGGSVCFSLLIIYARLPLVRFSKASFYFHSLERVPLSNSNFHHSVVAFDIKSKDIYH